MKKLLNPFAMFAVGLALGVLSRVLDIYTQNIGNVFSQMSIWIIFGVLITVYSETQKKAMLNILLFCSGMLITYYAAAVLSGGVYGKVYIIGWTVFALLSPIMAYFTWMTKEKGIFPKIISAGIILVSVMSSILLFDGFRWYDFVINAILVYILFIKR